MANLTEIYLKPQDKERFWFSSFWFVSKCNQIKKALDEKNRLKKKLD